MCLATLGPGATNLVTGVADANMDCAPVVAIAGQGATTRLHKESHQILDLVRLFEPISKYSVQIRAPEIIPEVIRKAFKLAEAEKPGCSFISFPENIAGMDMPDKDALPVRSAAPPLPPADKIAQAAKLISNARYPIIIAGNGVLRAKSSSALQNLAEVLNIPVANTFMAKGVLPFSHRLSLGAVGLQASDYVSCGIDRADVVICAGYDIVEYHPRLWHHNSSSRIIHIDALPAEVDEHYPVDVEVVGKIGATLDGIAEQVSARQDLLTGNLRQVIVDEMAAGRGGQEFSR